MRRLAVVLSAAGLLLWLSAVALPGRPFVPRVVEFEQALAPDDGAGPWRSPVIRAPARFDLVGLTWRAGARNEIESSIRVRDASSGRWRAWTLMAGNHAGGAGVEPVWAGGADAYQLRMARRPRDLRARFVNATGTATPVQRATTAVRRAIHGALAAVGGREAVAQGGAPAIVPRAAWAGDQCPPRAAPVYGGVQAGFVHHTVNANTYTREQSAAIVLSICRYHRNTNRWRDVGYNFLVDRYGQIFEGRAGGIDQPVIGAQAQGYNGVSTGVANIGTFSSEPQTAEGIRATAHLLAWKLTIHDAPVTGPTTVVSAGGPTNHYEEGTPVTFERISGHRDADATACPGDALFAQLPDVRAQAAALAPSIPVPVAATSTLTLDAADRTLEYPQAAQLTGRATAVGEAPLAGAPVSVQIASGSGFQTLARTITSSDGTWSAQLPTQYSRTLRAVTYGPDGARVTSPQVAVRVAPLIRLRAPRRVRARREMTISASMRPRRARLVLEIAREGTDLQMHTVARVTMRVHAGRFRAKVRLRRPALHRLRVVFAGDARNLASRSGDAYLRAVRGVSR